MAKYIENRSQFSKAVTLILLRSIIFGSLLLAGGVLVGVQRVINSFYWFLHSAFLTSSTRQVTVQSLLSSTSVYVCKFVSFHLV